MSYLKLTIGAVVAIIAWLVFVFFGAFYGWWMFRAAPAGDTDLFFDYASERLQAENPGNAALVLIENGRVSRDYYSSAADAVNANTVFSTASMSKWFAAYAAMKLAEEGRLDLDSPVSDYLSRWNLPPSEFDNEEVTVRRLLSHTAGFADGLGFGDYHPGESLPSLESSLRNPRASSSERVRIGVSLAPGSEWRYSGGGYLLLELIVEEASDRSFEQYLQQSVFGPLDMSRSGYRYIGNYDNNAGSYATDGERADTFRYASKAATAFVTSATDLTKFVLSQIPQSRYPSSLGADSIAAMREAHGQTLGIDIWGLGTILYSPTAAGDFVFGHDGANDPAINTTARINPDNGDAVIVLLTGHPSLASNIGSEWVLWQTGYPDVLATDRVIASMFLPGGIGVLIVLILCLRAVFRHLARRDAQ